MADIPVRRDQQLELSLRDLKEGAIAAEPAFPGRRESALSLTGWLLCSGLGEAAEGMGEHRLHMPAWHAREPLEKLIHARAVFEVFEQGRDRYTCSLEHPGATELAGIAFDGVTDAPVQHTETLLARVEASNGHREAEGGAHEPEKSTESPAAEFKAKCLSLLDGVGPESIVRATFSRPGSGRVLNLGKALLEGTRFTSAF